MEQIDLATPKPAVGGTAYWRVRTLTLDLGNEGNVASAYVKARLCGNNGESLSLSYSGQAAYDDIIALNKANLTNNTLHKRVLNKFITLGQLAGSISGTPD